jgi:hypothetical protein
VRDKKIKCMKLLHLTLKKKWFDMVASGEKKEEYREINNYWIRRLNKNGMAGDDEFKDFDCVKFRNGYSKNAPTIVCEFEEIEISKGRSEWGAESGKEYFVIKLGSIIKE